MLYTSGFDCGASLVDARFDLGSVVSFRGFPVSLDKSVWARVEGATLQCFAANILLIASSVELGERTAKSMTRFTGTNIRRLDILNCEGELEGAELRRGQLLLVPR